LSGKGGKEIIQMPDFDAFYREYDILYQKSFRIF